MKHRLILACGPCGLDVMLRVNDGDQVEPVAKTLGRANYSVGITQDGSPRYIHIQDAETLDPIFAAVLERLQQKQNPDPANQDHIAQAAYTLMFALAFEHQKRNWLAHKEDLEVQLCPA